MAIIGYGRVSTDEQDAGLEGQIRDLTAAGCEPDHIYTEKASSVADVRPVWEQCKAFMRKGDVLVVTKPDRLARSTRDLLNILNDLKARGISIHIIGMNLDTRQMTAMQTFQLQMLASVAEFERSLMLERQRDGIAKARREGKYKGRPPSARKQTDAILALHRAGKGNMDIANELDIDRSSVYRILRAAGVIQPREAPPAVQGATPPPEPPVKARSTKARSKAR
jgi:DNA invertase Pin-like site-specific DNA recombinase